MVAPPVDPKIPVRLEPWGEDDAREVEIDAQHAFDVDLTEARTVQIDSSLCEHATLLGTTLDTFQVSDSRLAKIEASAIRAYRVHFRRVIWEDSRISGADFAEGSYEDCVFKNCKLDGVNFKFANFKRVRFIDCVLDGADLSNAKLSHVTLQGCSLEAASFVAARITSTDISEVDITGCKGVLGLKGATISGSQLLQIAPLLASELGFKVKET